MAGLLKRLLWFFKAALAFFKAALKLLDVRLPSCEGCGEPTRRDDGYKVRIWLEATRRFFCEDCAYYYDWESRCAELAWLSEVEEAYYAEHADETAEERAQAIESGQLISACPDGDLPF